MSKWKTMLAYGVTLLLAPFIWLYFKVKDAQEREHSSSRSRWI